ncbi:hypothetical protein TcBrA4_0101420 [Trypanosoma cruzi]|nr:hypothetical protein TcBrA4_0101420 [Trypanosoma cruzi]
MSTAPVREELTGETQRLAGSDLLWRKLPLLAKAYALAQHTQRIHRQSAICFATDQKCIVFFRLHAGEIPRLLAASTISTFGGGRR